MTKSTSQGSDSSFTILLAGGLGNQLFQLSFALSQAMNEKVYLEWTLGDPRLNFQGTPEICNFNLPGNVYLLPGGKSSLLSRKLTNLILRMSALSGDRSLNNIFARPIKFIASVFLESLFLKNYKIVSPNGVGFDSKINIFNEPQFGIGYFQSYKWAANPSVKSIMLNLKCTHNPEIYKQMELLAQLESPIILHLRIGDYQSEKSFGRPSDQYYENSTKELWQSGEYRKIWIFSDSPEIARQLLPEWILGASRWFNYKDFSSAFTLEIMRLGHAYVLSNSTYSWWSAFLSYYQPAKVIVPSPWFKSIPDPQDLLPPSWEKRHALQ